MFAFAMNDVLFCLYIGAQICFVCARDGIWVASKETDQFVVAAEFTVCRIGVWGDATNHAIYISTRQCHITSLNLILLFLYILAEGTTAISYLKRANYTCSEYVTEGKATSSQLHGKQCFLEEYFKRNNLVETIIWDLLCMCSWNYLRSVIYVYTLGHEWMLIFAFPNVTGPLKWTEWVHKIWPHFQLCCFINNDILK